MVSDLSNQNHLIANCQKIILFEGGRERYIPVNISYDGETLWVASQQDQTVNPGGKGAVFRVKGIGVLSDSFIVPNPTDIIFDGTKMWIGDSISRSLLEGNCRFKKVLY